MFALGFLVIAAGAVLVDAGITGRSIRDLIRAGVTGTKAAATPSRSTSSSSAFGAGPAQTAGVGDQGDPLVQVVGQPGFRLQPQAAAALQAAERTVGRQIVLTSAYRSAAQQLESYARDPILAARPGKSWHERGLAIDVRDRYDEEIRAALVAHGWHQFSVQLEPWHFSYGVTG